MNHLPQRDHHCCHQLLLKKAMVEIKDWCWILCVFKPDIYLLLLKVTWKTISRGSRVQPSKEASNWDRQVCWEIVIVLVFKAVDSLSILKVIHIIEGQKFSNFWTNLDFIFYGWNTKIGLSLWVKTYQISFSSNLKTPCCRNVLQLGIYIQGCWWYLLINYTWWHILICCLNPLYKTLLMKIRVEKLFFNDKLQHRKRNASILDTCKEYTASLTMWFCF